MGSVGILPAALRSLRYALWGLLRGYVSRFALETRHEARITADISHGDDAPV
jgi:hypothetical protein